MTKPAFNRPFLKWAGGKTRILSQVLAQVPATNQLYIEPFLGGGVVFLNIVADRYIIADRDADLINVWSQVKYSSDELIERLKYYFRPTKNNDIDYYRLREKYNRENDQLRRAALFIYLNRHCFNGLHRKNSDGEFNVPFGKYANVYCPVDEIRLAARQLKNAQLICADFKQTFLHAREHSLVYADPPYYPRDGAMSNFTDYTGEGFGEKEHQELHACARAAVQRGAKVLISNHDCRAMRKLYSDDQKKKISVRRSISAKATTRTTVSELLVTVRPEEGVNE